MTLAPSATALVSQGSPLQLVPRKAWGGPWDDPEKKEGIYPGGLQTLPGVNSKPGQAQKTTLPSYTARNKVSQQRGQEEKTTAWALLTALASTLR